MKKLLAALSLVGVLSLPAFAFADTLTQGVQSQAGTITAWSDPVGNAAAWLNIATGTAAVNGCGFDCGTRYLEQSSPFTITGQSISFPAGAIVTVANGNCYGVGGCFDGSATMYDAAATITYTPAGGGGSPVSSITIPTSTAPALTATIGTQLSDPGTLLVVGLVAGVPLTFYVMQQLIALLPGNSKNRRG